MTAAINCLDWIRRFGLLNSQVKYFNTDNPTSYGLKHHIEDFNRQNHGQSVSHPAYIMNGAVMVAMVVSGYRVKQATRMNVWFNISRKTLTFAMNKK
ncbi:hypothetical protein [Raoultella sp. C349492]|uniref:hypothetical protein n=1 Tax=Raoultella sp. C349492 TaxID=2970253 RepID=UPI0035C706A5